MYFVQGDGDITLGEGVINNDGSITINSLSKRNETNAPLIADINPIWTSENSASWKSYFGGRIGLDVEDEYNYFFAQTVDGVRSSGRVILEKNSKWNIYPIKCGKEFLFLFLDVMLNPLFLPLTLDKSFGTFTVAGYPLVSMYNYIVYRIDDNLAYQLVGHSLESRSNGFLELGYPSGQLDETPRYFDVIEPDESNSCKVLSISNPKWEDHSHEGFTVYVKSSNYCYLYVHIIPGEKIESGYYQTVTDEDSANVHHGVFGTINLTEQRKCSIYLYKTRINEDLHYLDYGGFVFAFDRDLEESGDLHRDVPLIKGMTYLLSPQLLDTCYIIHPLTNKGVFEAFESTAPFYIEFGTGAPKGPSEEIDKTAFAAWTIYSLNRISQGWNLYTGFYVVHPGEIIVDYNSPLWEDDFSLRFNLGDYDYILIIYEKESKDLYYEYHENKPNVSERVMRDNLNIDKDTNYGYHKNPMIMFFKNIGESNYYIGGYGILVVSEVSPEVVEDHKYTKSEELAFYDHWNFNGDDWHVDFIPDVLGNTGNIYTEHASYTVDFTHGLYLAIINFPATMLPNEFDEEKTDDLDQDYYNEYRKKPSGPVYEDINTTIKPDPDPFEPTVEPTPVYPTPDPIPNPTPLPPTPGVNTPEQTTGEESSTTNENPKYEITGDNVNFPDIPGIHGMLTGLYQIYLISPEQLANLASFLWSDSFLDIVKKYLMSSPLESIISLSYGFITPLVGQSSTIYLHNLNSGANGQKLTSQIITGDFGYIDIRRNFANFLDYSPRTKIEIFLPFIGNQLLDTNVVMGSRLHLQYMFDFYTGSCVAHLKVERDNNQFIAYTFNGCFLAQIPVTAETFNQRVNSLFILLSAITTQNPLMLLSANPVGSSITETGQATSIFGAMSVKEPYLKITRPSPSLSSGFKKIYGIPSSMYGQLSTFKGFTKFENVLLESIPCTQAELSLIDNYLKNGVYL